MIVTYTCIYCSTTTATTATAPATAATTTTTTIVDYNLQGSSNLSTESNEDTNSIIPHYDHTYCNHTSASDTSSTANTTSSAIATSSTNATGSANTTISANATSYIACVSGMSTISTASADKTYVKYKQGSSFKSADQPLISVGRPVKLLKNFQVVGLGKILSGDHVHGKTIPQGYFRIEITQILPEIRLMFSTPFDDDFLMNGQITAWPKDQCIHC